MSVYTYRILYVLSSGNANMLLFSEEEINTYIDLIDYILIVDHAVPEELFPDSKIYNVERNNPHYAKLKGFKAIAKLYFPLTLTE